MLEIATDMENGAILSRPGAHNKGTVEDVPYRVARREVEDSRLQRNIWACK